MKKHIQRHIPKAEIAKRMHEPTAIELAFREAQIKAGSNEPFPAEVSAIVSPPVMEKRSNLQAQSYRAMPPSVKNAVISSTSSDKSKFTKSPNITNQNLPGTRTKVLSSNPEVKITPLINPNIGLEKEDISSVSLTLEKPSNFAQTAREDETIKQKQQWSGLCQVHNGKPSLESDIVMGIDFGTSSSKVIIRDFGRNVAYAVPFEQSSSSQNNYLIPTRIFINEDDGTVSLFTGQNYYDDIKSILMENPEKNIYGSSVLKEHYTITELATAYLSLVIIYARDWFLKDKAPIYKQTHIQWNMNIGIPSKDYDDTQKRTRYELMSIAAWGLSLSKSPIQLSVVKRTLSETKKYLESRSDEQFGAEWIHPDFVGTHPEVIMEIVGYAKSALRTEGLHLIVDVGATTLDVATFIIHKHEGENVFPILESAVERLGTMVLHDERVMALKLAMEESFKKVLSINPMQPLPENKHYINHKYDDIIRQKNEVFFDSCHKIVAQTISETRKRRDPNSSAWSNELPVFICGGGGRLDCYREMIRKLSLTLQNAWEGLNGFVVKEIPAPTELEAPGLSHADYDRLAVAYGLSFTLDEIGEVIPKHKIENISRQRVRSNIEDRYVSKEMC